MIKIMRVCIAVLLSMLVNAARADSYVFNLYSPDAQQVLDALHAKYGDKLQAELVQGKLVVVGSKQQLNEVNSLLKQIDPAPARLRLQLREQPPNSERSSVITYSSDTSGYTVDTVEGALVSIDHSVFSQQVVGAGGDISGISNGNRSSNSNTGSGGSWWVVINNTPTEIRSLTLQIRLQNNRSVTVLVSYAREENQERRVYGNTVGGDLGSWIPLLPQSTPSEDGTISSGPKPGNQLYLRIDKRLTKTQQLQSR